MRIKKEKVAVAMSGGVDSGVAAGLLVWEGYKCAGFHMKLWQEELSSTQGVNRRTPLRCEPKFENKCCSTESLEAARKTAHKLGMPFYIVDLEKIFKKRVVDYFLKEYAAGLTPNPCVMCNKFIKFGELLDYVKKLGYDYLATGHYARVKCDMPHVTRNTKKRVTDQRVTYHLLQGVDKQKDQSYFLYNLTQKQLAHILFPVGNYTKREVVAMAKKWQLPVAERPESQEICFFPETDYRPFLKRQIPKRIKKGLVVDSKGEIIGEHHGLPLYTIGQRHGFEINATRNKRHVTRGLIPPFYVIGKDVKTNRLIVGFGKEAERKEFWVKEVGWIAGGLKLEAGGWIRCRVRIRHQGELLRCEVRSGKWEVGRPARFESPARQCQFLAGGRSESGGDVRSGKWVKVVLSEGERGIAPGQAVVFYQDEEVLGGGIMAPAPKPYRI